MVLVSGRLAAERIAGPDIERRPRPATSAAYRAAAGAASGRRPAATRRMPAAVADGRAKPLRLAQPIRRSWFPHALPVDPFGDDIEPELGAEVDDRADDGLVSAVMVDPTDEPASILPDGPASGAGTTATSDRRRSRPPPPGPRARTAAAARQGPALVVDDAGSPRSRGSAGHRQAVLLQQPRDGLGQRGVGQRSRRQVDRDAEIEVVSRQSAQAPTPTRAGDGPARWPTRCSPRWARTPRA